jgi:hypothetical protein
VASAVGAPTRRDVFDAREKFTRYFTVESVRECETKFFIIGSRAAQMILEW